MQEIEPGSIVQGKLPSPYIISPALFVGSDAEQKVYVEAVLEQVSVLGETENLGVLTHFM